MEKGCFCNDAQRRGDIRLADQVRWAKHGALPSAQPLLHTRIAPCMQTSSEYKTAAYYLRTVKKVDLDIPCCFLSAGYVPDAVEESTEEPIKEPITEDTHGDPKSEVRTIRHGKPKVPVMKMQNREVRHQGGLLTRHQSP